ncbi:TetR/AcrR family transcriptional regulator [Oscillochloris sp. ZM17-4]|uniref:TetR/AcrR family transcriptional regulator n=1 Tax=Oscillochloris sp. ZM17-4 TaxID=2866714 RepID=UPI001C739492|nr:TetR/AcrR family transcriptional regulator [Oscillochloris sp. ZM17-4]MBX0327986.1 TetR/AcrR family transcriptional regulator [Oscillochloris sp. ZM17-4]
MERDNRAHILDHALTLFAARGYDGVGVQQICAAAGVTKPTLYHYFGSKSGLLATLVQERSASFRAALAEATAYAGDLPVSLERVALAYFAFATSQPLLYRLLIGLWFIVPEGKAFQVVLDINEEQQHLVESLFERAAADHGNMRGRHRIYAATFIGTLNTYAGIALNGYGQIDAEAARRAMGQFSYGIYS